MRIHRGLRICARGLNGILLCVKDMSLIGRTCLVGACRGAAVHRFVQVHKSFAWVNREVLVDSPRFG